VDAPLLSPRELVRPWKRATIAAGTIAAAELVLLIGAAALLFAKPVAHAIQHHALATATAAPTKQLEKAIKQMNAPAGKPSVPRGHLKVMVFNGNGLAGAAGSAAGNLQNLGYKISGTANAKRQDYASTVVMYKPGFRSEGMRLAQDIHVKVVGPLDGVTARTLHGSQLAVIVGA
jgi:hypothetical protein